MRRIHCIAIAVLVMSACAGRAQRTTGFMSAVRAYNDGLRWDRLTSAASFIPPAEREEFLDEWEELEDELCIDDFEITRVKFGERQNRAFVHIKYTWHLDSKGIVHTTTSKQSWERRGSRWRMAEERRLRGESMPGVPDPPKKRDPKKIKAASADRDPSRDPR